VRNLVSTDPWRESLERSLARRGKPRSSSVELKQLRMGRRVVIENTAVRERDDRTSARPRKPAKRVLARRRIVASLAMLALLSAGAGVAFALGTRHVARAADVSRGSSPHHGLTASISHAVTSGSGGCPMAAKPKGYRNPLAAAAVRSERIDQGVDYAGAGALAAIGAAKITYLATSGTGWPGAFIEYRLLDGADAGCFVYYAEGVNPIDGLTVGATVSAGEAIATIIPDSSTGIELGWAAGDGTKPYAGAIGQWSISADENDLATPAGKSFSALIASLGGTPGKVEG
jgi:hypothetical protein